MKSIVIVPLTLVMITLFIGCQKDKEEVNIVEDKIAINQIEKNITKKETTLGCDNNHTGQDECTQESDSVKFILNALEKDLTNNIQEDIGSIKNNLTLSLAQIAEEENQKDKLKENLMALVNQVENDNREVKAKKLQNFINNIDDSELVNKEERKLGISQSKNIKSIKDEITELLKIEESKVNPQEVKERLEGLIEGVIKDRENLSQTEQSLTNLVKEVEKENSLSAKKFATAMIEDVSTKKIKIVEEKENYFMIKVQDGDNLSILAKRYYNDKNKYKLIYEANKDKINSKYEIYPNSTLLIPKI